MEVAAFCHKRIHFPPRQHKGLSNRKCPIMLGRRNGSLRWKWATVCDIFKWTTRAMERW